MGIANLVDDGSFAVRDYPLTKADSDAYERCQRCTQLFSHEELEDGLCSWCGERRHQDLPAGTELESSVRYAGRS